MKRLICICVAIILLAAAPAMPITGNKLKELADEGEKRPLSLSEGIFSGYVLGIADIATDLCIPKSVTHGQTTEVVRKYLKAHLEGLHMPAGFIVKVAIDSAWPCPVQPQKGSKP